MSPIATKRQEKTMLLTRGVPFLLLLCGVIVSRPVQAQGLAVTVDALSVAPTKVEAGHTVDFTFEATANESVSNYPIEFSWGPYGSSTLSHAVVSATYQAHKLITATYVGTIPTGAATGTFSLVVDADTPSGTELAHASTSFQVSSAAVTAVNGACGPANGTDLASAPSTNLCSAGTASAVAGTGPWSWSCTGSGGGTTASCEASLSSSSSTTTSSSSGGNVAFTPLHIYYMSPSGNDSNSGTSASSAWATPNHTGLVCGDVIIAAPGNYTAWEDGIGITDQPSNCPSTSGGIDGKGGIYFATVLCGGNVGSCYVNATGGAGPIFDVTASYWAFEGFQVSSNSIGSSGMRGFVADGGGSGTTIVHHIAFINDIATHLQLGYASNDNALNHNVPGNGVDYLAVIGSIAQNANDDPICLAAVDAVAVAPLNSAAGTHVYFYGNFAINNQNPACTVSDGEGMMFDTWDAHGFTGQGVIQNNILYSSSWVNVQVFQQNYNSSSPNIYLLNNTSYHSNVCTEFATGVNGGINIQVDGGFPWVINVQNNVDYEDLATTGCDGGGQVYAMNTGGNTGTTVNAGGSGVQNIFKGSQSSCAGQVCDSGNNVSAFNGFGIGTNTYENPSFKNTTDLLANRIDTPSCTSYTNVTACMGWNANTSTLTNPSVIYDLQPTASGTSGKGYQLPSTTCAANSYYPTWLKGVVYLQWNSTSSTLTENADLVSKPCGM
jgi:hypothetical protein